MLDLSPARVSHPQERHQYHPTEEIGFPGNTKLLLAHNVDDLRLPSTMKSIGLLLRICRVERRGFSSQEFPDIIQHQDSQVRGDDLVCVAVADNKPEAVRDRLLSCPRTVCVAATDCVPLARRDGWNGQGP